MKYALNKLLPVC